MRPIDVTVRFPSGMTVTESASYAVEVRWVYVSSRLSAVLREFSVTEAPPVITALIDGQTFSLEERSDGMLVVTGIVDPGRLKTFRQLDQLMRTPTKDQRQQFGRFLHTLSSAAFIGAIGLWHVTTQWTWANVLNEANLVIGFVLSFIIGMISMDGE
ncbi:hypothetical protein [Paraburkholderia megapolitana]|uniref:hypothetical protein n=1 Tax=Paraburkholderia megapolitana TaxID=420953 RepID=UPI0038BDE8C6